MDLGEYTKEDLGLEFEFESSPRKQHMIYKQWAQFYEKKQLFNKAIKANDNAHVIDNEHYPVIFHKGRCLLKSGKTKEALELTEKCSANDPNNLNYKLQKIDCIYELNDLEEALKITYNASDKKLIKNAECEKRLLFIHENFKQSVGPESGPMLVRKRLTIAKLKDEKSKPVFEGPLWKYRYLNKECDVDSNIESRKIVESALVKQRRKGKTSIVNHLYLDRTTTDLQFLKNLQKDKRLQLPQCPASGDYITKLAKEAQTEVENYRTMLKTRQPVYSKQHAMVKNEEGIKKYNLAILHRKQLQVRRDIFKQLENARQLAADGKADELGNYVGEILGSYYNVHTIREMPRKFEFANELCNIVAITYLSELSVPKDIMTCDESDQIKYILGVSLENRFDQSKMIHKFGDRPTPPSKDYVLSEKRKSAIAYLEKSMASSTYTIEKCFYLYEISKLHSVDMRFDAIQLIAPRIVAKAKLCNNYPWMYLGNYMHARAVGAQEHFNNLKIILYSMEKIAENLNENIRYFNRTVSKMNLMKIRKINRELRLLKEKEEAENKKRKLKREMLLKK